MTENTENYFGEGVESSPYAIAKSERCHRRAWKYFVQNGDIPLSAEGTGEWCLHHIDPALKYFDLLQYAEWNISDVIPMKTSDHIKLHADFERRNEEYGFLDDIFLAHI